MFRFAATGLFVFILFIHPLFAQQKSGTNSKIITGAERTTDYLPFLKDKKVAVFANQTSVIGSTHLVDSLIAMKVNVVKIFGPEHGFRGKADAGEHVANGTDSKTGLPVISLYGDHKKPTAEDLKDVDVLIYDIQDVGVRFYTFISSLQLFLEAALENDKLLVILDRPNPNGFYVDGPVLEPSCKSFVGMQPIPIVHGLTVCEYAQMLMSERWLSNAANKKLDELNKNWDNAFPPIKNVDTYFGDIHPKDATKTAWQKNLHFSAVILPCLNYTHDMKYQLPVNPSPNLREMQSIYWYPSTCLFEGTVLSEGRGTAKPFQIFGHPLLPKNLYAFTPQPNEGAKSSKCFNQVCYGWNVSGSNDQVLQHTNNQIQLKYLLEAYRLFPGKDSFFLKTNFFNKLAGNEQLMQQIKAGASEDEIRKSWAPALDNYKIIRKRYLLYPDFK